MDYDLLNSAIQDIICIVNYYNKQKNYSIELCESLIVVLFGYYLVFGPEIFEKINIILDSLIIYECDTKESCIELKNAMFGDETATSNPATNWDYRYDENKMFIGAVPRIIYANEGIIKNSFTLVHELSHALEGVCGEVISENNKKLVIKQSLCEIVVDKDSNKFCVDSVGIVELITVIIENRIFKEFLKLDVDKIENSLIKDFVALLVCYRNKNILIDSYEVMTTLFSDLICNDYFFEIIIKHYYNSEPELFALEYNSLGEGLNFNILKTCAQNIMDGELYNVMYYSNALRKQIDLFNKYTGVESDKRILILV